MTFVIFLKRIFFRKQYWILNKCSSAIVQKNPYHTPYQNVCTWFSFFLLAGTWKWCWRIGLGSIGRRMVPVPATQRERERYYVLVNWYTVCYNDQNNTYFIPQTKTIKPLKCHLFFYTCSMSAVNIYINMLLRCWYIRSCAAGIWAFLLVSELCIWAVLLASM